MFSPQLSVPHHEKQQNQTSALNAPIVLLDFFQCYICCFSWCCLKALSMSDILQPQTSLCLFPTDFLLPWFIFNLHDIRFLPGDAFLIQPPHCEIQRAVFTQFYWNTRTHAHTLHHHYNPIWNIRTWYLLQFWPQQCPIKLIFTHTVFWLKFSFIFPFSNITSVA